MENNQSTQQSSELGYSKLTRSRQKTALLDNLNSLLTLFKHWPWLIWGGVGVLLLAIAAIAILSLTHPISLEQEPEPKPIAAERPIETSFQRDSYVPLWVVGAAALTFATGSLVIFKLLNSSSWSFKLRGSSGRALTRRQQRKLLLQGYSSVHTQPEPSPPAPISVEIEPVVILPPEESHSLTSAEESLAEMLDDSSLSTSEIAESEPVVTVLPPENHLVDSGESLAEIMDIRKHRSLASILQNSKS